MHRWGLVNSAHDRLEVVDVERPRVEVAIPAHDIERMVIEHDLVDPIVLLHEDRKISHLVDWIRERRPPDIALRVRRTFDELTELIAVSLGPAHVPSALKDHELWLLGVQVEAIAVEDAAMDDEVIAFPERELTVRSLENSFTLADVNELVRLGVAIKMRVVLVWLDVEHRDVLVEQER